jgi:hypothetical protein
MRPPLKPFEAADLIERFLNGKELYPQEWNDFVDGVRVEQSVESYRKRCDALDPLVNRPGTADSTAVEELRTIVSELRKL